MKTNLKRVLAVLLTLVLCMAYLAMPVMAEEGGIPAPHEVAITQSPVETPAPMAEPEPSAPFAEECKAPPVDNPAETLSPEPVETPEVTESFAPGSTPEAPEEAVIFDLGALRQDPDALKAAALASSAFAIEITTLAQATGTAGRAAVATLPQPPQNVKGEALTWLLIQEEGRPALALVDADGILTENGEEISLAFDGAAMAGEYGYALVCATPDGRMGIAEFSLSVEEDASALVLTGTEDSLDLLSDPTPTDEMYWDGPEPPAFLTLSDWNMFDSTLKTHSYANVSAKWAVDVIGDQDVVDAWGNSNGTDTENENVLFSLTVEPLKAGSVTIRVSCTQGDQYAVKEFPMEVKRVPSDFPRYVYFKSYTLEVEVGDVTALPPLYGSNGKALSATNQAMVTYDIPHSPSCASLHEGACDCHEMIKNTAGQLTALKFLLPGRYGIGATLTFGQETRTGTCCILVGDDSTLADVAEIKMSSVGWPRIEGYFKNSDDVTLPGLVGVSIDSPLALRDTDRIEWFLERVSEECTSSATMEIANSTYPLQWYCDINILNPHSSGTVVYEATCIVKNMEGRLIYQGQTKVTFALDDALLTLHELSIPVKDRNREATTADERTAEAFAMFDIGEYSPSFSFDDDKGIWMASAPGEALLQLAMISDGLETTYDYTNILRLNAYNAPKGIKLSPSSKTLCANGDSFQLEVLYTGSAMGDDEFNNIKYSSSNTRVATVTEKGGLVTAAGTGTATITAKAYNGKAATCKVTVVAAPVALDLQGKADTAYVGETLRLTPVVYSNAEKTKAIKGGCSGRWNSTVPSVATVQDGTVRVLSAGSSIISYETYDGKLTDQFTLTTSALAGGFSVTLAPLTVRAEQTIQLLFDGAEPSSPLKNPTFSSSDPKVATVDTQGKVTGKKVGRTVLTVNPGVDGVPAYRFAISVLTTPAKIFLPVKSLTLVGGVEGVLGETFMLAPNFGPSVDMAALEELHFTFKASNTDVVDLDAGLTVCKLTALKPGTSTITIEGTYQGAPKTLKASLKVTVSNILPVSASLSFTGTEKVLGTGETFQVTATLRAKNGKTMPNRKGTWETMDELVATVRDTGLITAVDPGNTAISFTPYGGAAPLTFNVKVLAAPTWEDFTVVVPPLSLKMKVSPTVSFEDGVYSSTVQYISSDPKVLTIDKKGVVTAKKAGVPVTVLAIAHNGAVAAQTMIIDSKLPDWVLLPSYTKKMEFGGSTYTVTPTVANGASTAFAFKSSNPRLVSVSAEGVVKVEQNPTKATTVRITVKTHNGKSGVLQVGVNPK